jgi:hypothetical protein
MTSECVTKTLIDCLTELSGVRRDFLDKKLTVKEAFAFAAVCNSTAKVATVLTQLVPSAYPAAQEQN